MLKEPAQFLAHHTIFSWFKRAVRRVAADREAVRTNRRARQLEASLAALSEDLRDDIGYGLNPYGERRSPGARTFQSNREWRS